MAVGKVDSDGLEHSHYCARVYAGAAVISDGPERMWFV